MHVLRSLGQPRAAGCCEDHRRQISSLGNLTLHNLQMVFRRFETWVAMFHYYFCARDSWMVASIYEAS